MERVSTPEIEVRRSARRRRTVSAYREGDRIVVLIPAAMSKRDEKQWVADMVARLERKERRTRPSDDQLLARAVTLNDTYFGGLATPSSVRWVTNQQQRWGSCSPGDRSIRLSERLQGMPSWVVDYVLVHELAHLLEHGHDEKFWALGGPLPALRAGAGLPAGLVGRGQGGPAVERDRGRGRRRRLTRVSG